MVCHNQSDYKIGVIYFFRAPKAGIEGKITPHSLRSGFATQAVRDGVNVKQVMAMTDHKSVKVFMGYVEAEDLLTSDAGKLL
ncbi:tyrosine-type recombinase/integrase [Thiolapillus sp.]|uniref:tyrosine-type recombinase/integrase n=1 Tax=Thiolapillus sp. TaxID=2017437 RepID=UPI003AF7E25F